MSFAIVGGILAVGGAYLGAKSADKAQKKAEKQEAKARREMEALKDTYRQLDTSNPYADMENVMEDLTINQRQYNLESQQFSQSQSNILSGLGEAAGSSGIAALAQTLAQQGQIASQRAAADIGAQEAQNQKLERQQAAQLQQMERRGELISRQQELQKQSTLLGMSQAETAAFMQQGQQAQQARAQDFDRQKGLASMVPGLQQADVSALGQVGAIQQAQTQAGLDATREAARQAAFLPQENLQRYAGQVTGLMGGYPAQTQSTNVPNPSPMQTALGVGSTLAGIYGSLGKGYSNFLGGGKQN